MFIIPQQIMETLSFLLNGHFFNSLFLLSYQSQHHLTQSITSFFLIYFLRLTSSTSHISWISFNCLVVFLRVFANSPYFTYLVMLERPNTPPYSSSISTVHSLVISISLTQIATICQLSCLYLQSRILCMTILINLMDKPVISTWISNCHLKL